eukprot:scaffold85839_cov22-Tisochrysis_lutea.AAC.1
MSSDGRKGREERVGAAVCVCVWRGEEERRDGIHQRRRRGPPYTDNIRRCTQEMKPTRSHRAAAVRCLASAQQPAPWVWGWIGKTINPNRPIFPIHTPRLRGLSPTTTGKEERKKKKREREVHLSLFVQRPARRGKKKREEEREREVRLSLYE